MRLPTRKSEQDRLLMQQVDPHLTPRRMQQLSTELERLKAEQPAAIADVQHTASMGDFSENAAYQQAKHNLRRLNARMLNIEEALKQAIPIVASKNGRVQLGSIVTLEHDGGKQTFELVGAQEANPSRGRLSHLSPLGSLLIGHRVGDEVTLAIGQNKTTYRITGIK